MKKYNSKQQQKGMTLLEVVVSMLIVGVGLGMSIAMIQTSKRYGDSAEYRSTAVREIESIIDAMRANVLGAEAYEAFSQGAAAGSLPALPCTAANSTCEIEQELVEQATALARTIAQTDVQNWQDHVRTSLPNGAGVIAGSNGVYTVTVTWRTKEENTDKAMSSDSRDEQIDMTFSL